MLPVTRRSALLGLTAAWALGGASLALADVPGDERFVVVILRGALDGLAAVIPYGDRNLAQWRGPLVPPPVGSPGGMLDLGGFYGLHPALAGFHDFYGQSEMLAIHAVAGGYRTRSHFDAQDYLESGTDHRLTSGWLNRAVMALPRLKANGGDATAIGITIPLLLRGPAAVENWAPEGYQTPPADFYARALAMNAHDPLTGDLIRRGLAERSFADGVMGADMAKAGGNNFMTLAAAVGRLMAAPNGPRIAALEAVGWDTHERQNTLLAPPLRGLDQGLVAFRAALGPAWDKTVVLIMTEFGRTVRVNGTAGTDHGTAGVAFVLGGAVAGGKVAGTWPGLGQNQLFENRDLAPTTDLRAVALGLMRDHLGLPRDSFAAVFPGSGSLMPTEGLVRS